MSTTPSTWLDSFFVSIGPPIVVVGGAYQMNSGDAWLYIHAGDVITFPGRPTVGFTHFLTAFSGNFVSTPATLNGNGRSIATPVVGSGRYTTASSVSAALSGVTYLYRFDGAIFQCVGVA